jgi:two-component system, cell cycle response regulator
MCGGQLKIPTVLRRIRSKSLLWAWALVAGAVLIAGFFAVNAWTRWEGATDLYYSSVSLLATMGIVAGIVMFRPRRPLPWILLAVGQLSYTVADVAFFVSVATETVRFPGVPDIFYLLQFPLVISALAVFVRRRTPGWHAPTWIDAAVLGTAASLVWWVYMISPVATGSELSRSALAVTVAYPVLDLLMLAMALRLMLGGGNRPASFRLLVASLVAMLVADSVYTLQTAGDSWLGDVWVNAIWLTSYVLGSAAALHPSMRSLDKSAKVAAPNATARRLSVLAAASLLAPTILLAQYLRADTRHQPVIAVTCMALFLLVLARMAGLVSIQRITAVTDGLTGLYTRGFFTDNLQTECDRARRSNRPIGVVIADVDHFKRINDTYGHPAGDAALVEVGKRLLAVSRANNTVARYGGEEFAILLPGASAADTAAVGERIRAAITATPIAVNGETALDVTASVGTATATGAHADPESLIRAADDALYAAKHQGRNRVVTAAVNADPTQLARAKPTPIAAAVG